ncbi:alpha/beta fold hydrolase [Legionella bononiensis]|uniref:Alpha/beta fold hydrolase n=1 Tax=Legionella bononiensis TaxID=2793102 RepID=A0ABS1WE17_9GAMM|nr:alpha/beta fold hydrolase [Legionella bononiensis]MBL7479522.1 alpha/beta fold hydrolase [Legionella bononiensis]MBL7527604.1 alpha/beta fold hydrolase [Legionella bononiensis]
MNTSQERIALVGMACRLPDAHTVNEFWQNLIQGRVSTKKKRLWPDGSSAYSGFLDDPNSFDAAFFNCSPNEAQCMSPQLRQLLEVSYQAIESSGLTIKKLGELNTGVFCTSLPGDYKNILAQDAHNAINPYSFSGNAPSAMSGRLSYYYDFHGPSISIDTACSSGLTALHLAQLSIKNGDCDAALVGGASIFSTSEFHTLAAASQMLSKDHECAAFDEKADGFVASEAVICLVLIRESKAQELGIPVYGLIKELKLNHNGLSNGLMAPNAKQQESLIRQCYQQAGLSLKDIALFETHGTATKLGDSIELRGLANALGAQGDSVSYLGASKMIIGHCLVCSALASVIKVALSYHYQMIPPNPLFKTMNPLLTIPDGLAINTTAVPWPKGKQYASISAYGFTGSNGHLIMEFVEHQKTNAELLPPYSFERVEYHVKNNQQRIAKMETQTSEMEACIEVLCEVLSYQANKLDLSKSLAELGIDSLSALNVLTKLKERGYATSADKVWSAPTLRDFAHELTPPVHEDIESDIPGLRKKKSNGLEWLYSNGDGPILILLPPLNSDYKAWMRQIPMFLKRRYRLCIPHYPGHGAQALEESLVLEGLANKIADFAYSLPQKAHFIGWSLGGILSILIATVHRDLIKSMTLIACTTQFDESLFEKTVEMQDDLNSRDDLLKIVFQTEQSISEYISCKTAMTVLKDYYQELIHLSIEPQALSAISTPTQIILGKHDPVINAQQVERLKTIPHQALTVFEQAGHFIPITSAAEFNSLVLSFVDSIENTKADEHV